MKIRKFLIGLILYLIIFPYTVYATTTQVNDIDSIKSSLVIHAPCALMIEKESGDILYDRNSNNRMFPASTVKMMTAILTLEHFSLTDIVTISPNAVNSVPNGYSKSEIIPEENLTVNDLLHALLLPSGNDAANVLAESVAGNNENFAVMMNKKASDIGCLNTNFTNPSGIHDENMYTTAYDLALIAQYAMNIDSFRTIVSTPTYTLPSSNVYPNADRVLKNSNHLIHPDSSHYYQFATGIKTGYTNPAQNCLIASAMKDNIEFIVVILGSTASNFGDQAKFVDASTLFEFGFTHYLDYYTNLALNRDKLFFGIFNLETIVDTEMIVNEEQKPQWGYIAYLVARTVLLIIAIIYILYRLIKKIKRYIYNRTHAKYDYKY